MKAKWIFLVVLLTLLVFDSPAFADDIGMILGGTAKLVTTAFQAPFSMLSASGSNFPFGLVGGVVQGTYSTIMGTLSGATDVARGAAPYAKYMVFFI